MTTREPIRIAMWSGPRTISTAMMRSWGNRSDTWVVDEPLYAFYLTQRPVDHPGRDEVIRCHETDWRRVVEDLAGPIPEGRAIYYQKHMAHHLLPEVDRGWLDEVVSCFLIRNPREMINSLIHHMPSPELEDTGLPQQVEIFRRARDRGGRVPPVVDARDVLENPSGVLSRLCEAIGVPFSEEMLSWPAGPRETDGVWAKHWYESVHGSTGFQPYEPRPETLSSTHMSVYLEAQQHYRELYAHRLTADS